MHLSPFHVAIVFVVLLIAAVVTLVIWLIGRSAKRRDRDRREMLDLMREQARRKDE